MQSKSLKLTWVCGVALSLTLSACSSTVSEQHEDVLAETSGAPMVTEAPLQGSASGIQAYVNGVPGGVVSIKKELHGTIKKINTETREVTIQDAEGHQQTLTAPVEMVNFPQLKVNDKVNAYAVIEKAVFVNTSGEKHKQGAEGFIAAPEEGQQPSVLIAGFKQITATVKALDIANRIAILEFTDGSIHQVNVRPDIEINESYIGSEVVMQMKKELFIEVVSAQ